MSAMYRVQVHVKVMRYLDSLSGREARRIRAALFGLARDPYPRGAVRIKGHDSPVFRIRIGNYRALYHVRADERLVFVIILDKRSRIYERL